MSENNANVPKIRFPGFTDAWEQRKLLDITDSIGTGKSSFIKHEKSDDNPYAILGSTSIIGYDSEFDHEGDFILTARVGANAGNLYRYYGKAKITDNTVYIKGENLSFLYPLLNHFDLKKLSFGTGQPLVKASELKNLQMKSPSFEEQTQIGNFINQLDHLITLHQRKLNHLQDEKKSLLQNMFPKNGADAPEIRFPGFTDAWEQRKVIDIAPLQRGFDLPVSKMEAGPYPVIMSNGIGAYHSKYKVKAPGVVTGRSGTIGNLTFVETDYWPHNTALWVTDFKNNDAKFIYYLYQKLDLKRYGTGSGVPTLNRNDVHDTTSSIPSVSEQKQVSRLFTDLDHLITLHQRKLNHIQEQKKSLLQQMFV